MYPLRRTFTHSMRRRCMHTNVCIIGGGLAGLATATYLSDHGNFEITIIDSGSPGLSSVEAGLLHPLSPKGAIIWQGVEGMELTLKLARLAEAQGYKALRDDIQIVRPYTTHEKLQRYFKTADQYPNVSVYFLRIYLLNCCSVGSVSKSRRLPATYSRERWSRSGCRTH
jgi:hypothetical protein